MRMLLAEANFPASCERTDESTSHLGFTLVSPRRLRIVVSIIRTSSAVLGKRRSGSVRITKSLKTKLAGLLIVALCVSVAAPAMAGAQQVSPTGDQYDNELTQL